MFTRHAHILFFVDIDTVTVRSTTFTDNTSRYNLATHYGAALSLIGIGVGGYTMDIKVYVLGCTFANSNTVNKNDLMGYGAISINDYGAGKDTAFFLFRFASPLVSVLMGGYS
jgi:hypothetical protein